MAVLLMTPPCPRLTREVGCPGSAPLGLPCTPQACGACISEAPTQAQPTAALPNTQTHTGCSPPVLGPTSGARTCPHLRQAWCTKYLTSLSGLLGPSPPEPLWAPVLPSLELPTPLHSLSLPWVPDIGGPKVLASGPAWTKGEIPMAPRATALCCL